MTDPLDRDELQEAAFWGYDPFDDNLEDDEDFDPEFDRMDDGEYCPHCGSFWECCFCDDGDNQ